MSYIMVYVTTKDEAEASRIGETLVKEKLAACANIIPRIESVYWWQGKIEKNSEAALILKSSGEKADQIVNRVKEKLAACANIIPRIESVYWWQGKIEKNLG
jgi:periplasmic divalent cation tolerance protein